jgi:hypothetical protein
MTLDRVCRCLRNLPPLSACQLADICRVPGDRYKEFCAVLIAGVEARRIASTTDATGGVSIPLFEVLA